MKTGQERLNKEYMGSI